MCPPCRIASKRVYNQSLLGRTIIHNQHIIKAVSNSAIAPSFRMPYTQSIFSEKRVQIYNLFDWSVEACQQEIELPDSSHPSSKRLNLGIKNLLTNFSTIEKLVCQDES